MTLTGAGHGFFSHQAVLMCWLLGTICAAGLLIHTEYMQATFTVAPAYFYLTTRSFIITMVALDLYEDVPRQTPCKCEHRGIGIWCRSSLI